MSLRKSLQTAGWVWLVFAFLQCYSCKAQLMSGMMLEESSGDETEFILKVEITFNDTVNMTAFREYIFDILIDNVQIETDFIIFEFKEELTVCIYAIDNFGDYSNSLTQNIYMTLMDRQEDIMEKVSYFGLTIYILAISLIYAVIITFIVFKENQNTEM